MDEAQVVREHGELARSIAHTFARRYGLGRFREDLESHALEGLLAAVRTYEPEHGSAFTSWAWRKISSAVLDGCRASFDRGGRHRGRSEPADDRRCNRARLRERCGAEALEHVAASIATDPSRRAERRSTARYVRRVMASLDEDSREVLELTFLEGKTLDEVAALRGVSRGRACQVKRRALGRLRDELDRAAFDLL